MLSALQLLRLCFVQTSIPETGWISQDETRAGSREPGGRATAINREISSIADDLARLTAEWENATALVAPQSNDSGSVAGLA